MPATSPTQSIESLAHKFVELCRAGKNFDVMETMYAPDIVSVEADGKQWAGKRPVIDKSKQWATVNDFHGEKVMGPYFAAPNQFAVHFSLDVTRKASGERVTLEEVAVYTVKDGQITREQFFYEGAH